MKTQDKTNTATRSTNSYKDYYAKKISILENRSVENAIYRKAENKLIALISAIIVAIIIVAILIR